MKNHYQVVIELFQQHFKGRPITGIEIGTGGGTLTWHLLNDFPNVTKLYTIDSWEHRDGAEFEAGNPQEGHDRTKEMALKRIEQFGDRVQVFHARSNEIVQKFQFPYVDFVWIDGDHSEKGIKDDLMFYDPLVKAGGILGGHDYGLVHPLTEIIAARYMGVLNAGDDFTWYIFK